MSESFYPFVDSGEKAPDNHHITGAQNGAFSSDFNTEDSIKSEVDGVKVQYPARIAVYDDMLSTPRVIIIEPKDIRSYLEEITNTVNKCVKELNGQIPFMVIREIVENFIHAYFIEPTVSILDNGNTIRFADQGPGINNKNLALEAGMTSANENMKRYIRGVGSGFPTVNQYLEMIGGKLIIEDNMNCGTVVTVTIEDKRVNNTQEPINQEMPPVQEDMYAAQQAQFAYQNNPYAAQPMYGQMNPPMGMGQNPYPMQGMPPNNMAPQMYGYNNQQMYPQAYGQYGYMNMPPQPPMGHMNAPIQENPYISQRGQQAIMYMKQHGMSGPTDLASALGSSNATWSRELSTLANIGLVIKHGQKYILTEIGTNYIAE